MIKRFKRLNTAGDTIVEVLIVLAVLGMAISISYATANQGLQKSRNAQEHSQALGILNSQIELLRSVFAKDAAGSLPAGPFCLAPPPANSAINFQPLGTTDPSGKFDDNTADDDLNTTAYPGPCTQDGLYNVSIVSRGSDVFDFRVRWEGLGKLGRQQEQLTYKIDNVVPGIASGYGEPESPPPVTITCPNGSVVTPPAVCPPNTITCPNGSVVTPPAVCPPSNFNWTINGKDYSSCTNDPTDPLVNDNHDRCNPSADTAPDNANAEFSRRGVDIMYRFARGSLTGTIDSGPATLTINFNQYAKGNTVPPSNYSYQVRVKIDGATIGTFDLAPNTRRRTGVSQPSWAAKSQAFAVNFTGSPPTTIQLDWINNNVPGNTHDNVDPDLQINSVRLSRP